MLHQQLGGRTYILVLASFIWRRTRNAGRPPSADVRTGTAVAELHLRFIDTSWTVGGLVLDFGLESGRIAIDLDADLHVEMPAENGRAR